MDDIIPIIEKAKNGDQKAFSHILNLYWSRIYNHIQKKNIKSDEAEDITIIVFTKAFNSLDRFDSSKELSPWLFKIAENTFLDHTRKKSRIPKSFDIKKEDEVKLKDDNNTEEEFIKEEDLRSLLLLIDQLPPNFKQVILLKGVEELSYEDIARRTDQSLSNVKVRLNRGRKLLSNILQQKK